MGSQLWTLEGQTPACSGSACKNCHGLGNKRFQESWLVFKDCLLQIKTGPSQQAGNEAKQQEGCRHQQRAQTSQGRIAEAESGTGDPGGT